jgi:ATP-binding cassette, subfamily B, bacterial MsbA
LFLRVVQFDRNLPASARKTQNFQSEILQGCFSRHIAKDSPPVILKRFRPYFCYLKHVRLPFSLGLAFGVLYGASSGLGFPLVAYRIVPFVTGDDPPRGLALLGMLLIIPLVFLARALGGFLNAYLMAYSGMHVLERLRLDIFSRLQQLPLTFFGENTIGDLMSRVLGDTAQLQSALISAVDDLIKQPATLLGAGGALIFLALREKEIGFILIVLASVPACVLPIRFIGKRVLKKAQKVQAEAGQMNRILNENLSAIREVRAYNLEQREISRFQESCRYFLTVSLKVVKYQKFLTPAIEVVSAMGLAFAIYIAVDKNIGEEAIVALLLVLYMGYEPVKKLGAMHNNIRRAEASLDRLEYILHQPDTVPDAVDPKPFPRPQGHISFEQVGFSYTDTPVLHQIDIHLEAGRSYALVGPSGAGKSTFMNLIPRFYDATAGAVKIDGFDVRDISKADLRSQVALVSQEAILFADTLANNIRIGRPDASDDEVKAAAQLANAHEFIEKSPAGYQSVVGERGSGLSGGQRQRISIARAFLKNAPIILLDEPTSALDSESEALLQAALEKLARGRTVLIIAHRFSTILHADSILLFEDGRITATGSHPELYQTHPTYRSLYDKQAVH